MIVDWYLFMRWSYEASFSGPPDWLAASFPEVQAHRSLRYGGSDVPTELDQRLVALMMEFVSGRSVCTACSSPLRSRLRLVVGTGHDPVSSWRIEVFARCGGWRRHRHVAVAAREVSGDLVTGAFLRSAG